MIKIFRPRQSGKSTDLIKMSAVTGYYIVTANRVRAKFLFDLAQKYGFNIPNPFTVEDYLRSGKPKGSFIKKILIDDADAVLQAVFDTVCIEAITMTYEEHESMLDKIRAEVADAHLIGYATINGRREIASKAVLEIIDKYKAESEVRDERRIIEINDDDVNRVINPHGIVTHECERNIKEAFERSTVIGEDYKMPPRTKGLDEALEKVKEREKWEAQLASRSNDSDKHVYASILLQDIASQIEKIIEIDCAKENKRAFAKWAKEHSNDS